MPEYIQSDRGTLFTIKGIQDFLTRNTLTTLIILLEVPHYRLDYVIRE